MGDHRENPGDQPASSSGTIPMCKNPGATSPEIEPGFSLLPDGYPFGRLSQQAEASQTQGSFPESCAADKGMGLPSSEKPPHNFSSMQLSTLCLRLRASNCGVLLPTVTHQNNLRVHLAVSVQKCRAMKVGMYKIHAGLSVAAVRMLTSHQARAGLDSRRVAPAEIVLDDAAVQPVFSGISRFSPVLHSDAAPYSPRSTLVGYRDLDINLAAWLGRRTARRAPRHVIDKTARQFSALRVEAMRELIRMSPYAQRSVERRARLMRSVNARTRKDREPRIIPSEPQVIVLRPAESPVEIYYLTPLTQLPRKPFTILVILSDLSQSPRNTVALASPRSRRNQHQCKASRLRAIHGRSDIPISMYSWSAVPITKALAPGVTMALFECVISYAIQLRLDQFTIGRTYWRVPSKVGTDGRKAVICLNVELRFQTFSSGWSRGGGEYTEKIRRQAASSSTIPTFENLGANPDRRGGGGSALATASPLPLLLRLLYLHGGYGDRLSWCLEGFITAGGHEEKDYAATQYCSNIGDDADNRNSRISRYALNADALRRNLLHPDWLPLIATRIIALLLNQLYLRTPVISRPFFQPSGESCHSTSFAAACLIKLQLRCRDGAPLPFFAEAKSAQECSALSLWCDFLDSVELCLPEAEKYSGSRTRAGLQKKLKVPDSGLRVGFRTEPAALPDLREITKMVIKRRLTQYDRQLRITVVPAIVKMLAPSSVKQITVRISTYLWYNVVRELCDVLTCAYRHSLAHPDMQLQWEHSDLKIKTYDLRSKAKDLRLDALDKCVLRHVQRAAVCPALIDLQNGVRNYGGVVARLLASHQGQPSLIPSGIAPGFSQVGIAPDDAAGRRVFSEISRFPSHLNSGAAPYSPHFIPTGSFTTLLITNQSNNGTANHRAMGVGWRGGGKGKQFDVYLFGPKALGLKLESPVFASPRTSTDIRSCLAAG
ncbi:hypothetical protein PR048_027080 [Dryococelus australis]|uniref:Uncharacterized protein n=1 Tax=Dryococelus australis TaxID=614101 RepID=A0ABQ9GGJ6_9NEOP|nr:hypothetical protein PR048_027080 [Dryococelus australis]